MSIIYKAETSYSDSSDAFSPQNEHGDSPNRTTPYTAMPLINSPLQQRFFNAIQSRQEVWNQFRNDNETATDSLISITSENLNKILLDQNKQIIIIDIRYFNLYFQSRIKNAINLAVPSILLKRPSYTLEKVCNSVTLNMGERLKDWSKADCILFYDQSATDLIPSGNSATAILVGSKLRNDGYNGYLYYLKGGFYAFQSKYPEHCDSTRLNTDRKKLRKHNMAPSLTTPLKSGANPFFSNIRQNLELCHGPLKERFSIRLPSGFSASHLTKWLNDVIGAEKGPKKLAEMYEILEKLEQKRLLLVMDFHSSNPSYDPSSMKFPFCISANIEKGTMNRYNNIWPYEYSRVKLNNTNQDYINANYITYQSFNNNELSSLILSNEQDDLIKRSLISKESLYTMRRITKDQQLHPFYIATQAPVPETMNDFWKMIWNENSNIIVMLTQEEEMNKIKCHRYWPDKLQETLDYGSIKVTLLSEYKHSIININGKRTSDIGDEFITVRKFNLTTFNNEQRQLTHFQYTGWTDFGVPDHPLAVLELIRLVKQERKAYHQPIIVHCSAGCGRTGTFCVIDTVIQRLSQNSIESDYIYETVHRFREQRISMVQTHRQFVFCYEAIAWWLLLGEQYFTMDSTRKDNKIESNNT